MPCMEKEGMFLLLFCSRQAGVASLCLTTSALRSAGPRFPGKNGAAKGPASIFPGARSPACGPGNRFRQNPRIFRQNAFRRRAQNQNFTSIRLRRGPAVRSHDALCSGHMFSTPGLTPSAGEGRLPLPPARLAVAFCQGRSRPPIKRTVFCFGRSRSLNGLTA